MFWFLHTTILYLYMVAFTDAFYKNINLFEWLYLQYEDTAFLQNIYLFTLEKLEEKINNDIFPMWSWFERNYGIHVLKVVKKLSI